MRALDFDRSVFVNCPFDEEYQPLLQAMLFCLVDCDLVPRIATERSDSGEARLAKIVELMLACRYSIHDLSRLQAQEAGEFARMNMPFELGLDHGLTLERRGRLSTKTSLIVATKRYDYQKALSDIAGWDIRAHGDTFDGIIGAVRGWLAASGLTRVPPSQILGDYLTFQEWDEERLVAVGWEDEDIRSRTTPEILEAMEAWVEAERPVTY